MTKSYRILVYILSLLFLAWPSLAQETTQLKFGRSLALLALPDQILRTPDLSSDGAFIFVNTDAYDFDREAEFIFTTVSYSNQALWNIPAVSSENMLTPIEPQQVISLNEDKKASSKISPDDRYIAVKTDTQVQLLTLPDLELYKAISAPSNVETNTLTFYQYLSWSLDSQFLLIFVEDGLLVWDIEQNITQHYALPYLFGQSTALEDGWVIQYLEKGTDTFGLHPNTFAFCTLYLERCDLYKGSYDRVQVIAPDGSYIVTATGDAINDGQVDLWKRNPDGNYQVEETYRVDQPPFDILSGFCPMNTGSNNQYIFSKCGLQASIWDEETLELLQTISNVVSIVWLPDGDYFVAIVHNSPEIILELYQVGMDDPLDALELTSIPGFEEFVSWQVGSTYNIDELASVSDDGSKVLINLGLSAIIVPIEYA